MDFVSSSPLWAIWRDIWKLSCSHSLLYCISWKTVDTEYTYYSWCMTSADIVKWRKTEWLWKFWKRNDLYENCGKELCRPSAIFHGIFIAPPNSKYQSWYLTPCCWLEVHNPTHALKSVKGTVSVGKNMDTEYMYYSWCMTSTDIVKWRKKRMIMKILKKEWFIWKFWKKGGGSREKGGGGNEIHAPCACGIEHGYRGVSRDILSPVQG
jgi:hypothetical protein